MPASSRRTNQIHYRLLSQDKLLFCGKIDKTVALVHDHCERGVENERVKRISHHIKGDHYFEMLAAVLHIVANNRDANKKKMLKEVVCDLLYLQENYKIIKKD